MSAEADCHECSEAQALLVLLAVRDLLDAVIWRQTSPLRAVEDARRGLFNTSNMFKAAGYEVEP